MEKENTDKTDKKRNKKKNFTISEVEIIKDEVKKNFNVITAKHCSGTTGVTKKVQDGIWQKITNNVNALGVCERSVSEIKEKWNNMKKKAKEAFTKQKIHSKKTGGGPPLPVMDPISEDVAGLYKQSASFTGIPGSSDCESQIILTEAMCEMPSAEGDCASCSWVCPDQNDQTCTVEYSLFPELLNIEVEEEKSINERGDSTGNKHVEQTLQDVLHGSTKDELKKPDSQHVSKQESHHDQKRKSKSLKELQTQFYEMATKNQQQKASLFQAQIDMCKSISSMCQVQTELMTKMSSVLDKVVTNFCNK